MPRQKGKEPRAQMTVSLPPSLKRWVQKRATKVERFDSDIVRAALEMYRVHIETEESK